MTKANTSDLPPAKILKRETVFKGFRTLDVIEFQPRSLKHDGWAAPMEREVYSGRPTTAVLPYIPDSDEIMLVQQFRAAAFIAGAEDPFFYESVAGFIDEGETPEQTALRETLEETGAPLLDFEYIGEAYTSPAGLAERVHLFVGRIDKTAPGFHGLESEAEEIKTHLVSAKEAIHMLDTGKILNAKAVMMLHWFARNHERIRKKWMDKK